MFSCLQEREFEMLLALCSSEAMLSMSSWNSSTEHGKAQATECIMIMYNVMTLSVLKKRLYTMRLMGTLAIRDYSCCSLVFTLSLRLYFYGIWLLT